MITPIQFRTTLIKALRVLLESGKTIGDEDLSQENLHQSLAFLQGNEMLAQEQEPPPIKIWAFEDAPPDLKMLSTAGGDEDWIAVVPHRYRDWWRVR